jgi:hypothetical protein
MPTIKELRCPDGRRHDFSLKGTLYKVGSQYYKYGAIPAGSKHPVECCGNCKQSFEDLRKSTPREIEQIKAKIDHVIDVVNFYNYFENRCPANITEIHDYNLAKRCSKCGFTREIFAEQDPGYYKKYHKAMDLKHHELVSKVPTHVKDVTKPTAWSINTVAITQIAKLSAPAVNFNMWNNLGLSEGLRYNDIKDGKANPQASLTPEGHRIRVIKINNYLMFCKRTYYTIKNHSRMQISPDLKPIVDKITTNTSMENILEDYDLDKVLIKADYPAAANYTLHHLATLLMSFKGSKKLGKVGDLLFHYCIDHIFQNERMISKLDVVKQKIMAAPEDDENTTVIDDDTYLELGEQKDILDKGTSDPFSLDDVDIETSNMGNEDEEPMD